MNGVVAVDVCPAGCKRPLSTARIHCRSEDRKTPCGWLRCDCGAVIREDGHWYPPVRDPGGPRA